MSLRTYHLISHPAFHRFVEDSHEMSALYKLLPAAAVPAHLPQILRPYDLAKYLGVSPLIIRSLLKKKEKHYRSFQVRKRSGDMRTIHAPKTFMKVVQWWILDNILELKAEFPFVFGFVKGRSFIDNARFHVGARHILNVDIKNFFPSIDIEKVTRYFDSLGYPASVSEALAELCTYEGSLPQGAPTSPKLANFVFAPCDVALENLAREGNMKYTRYADDITFSSIEKISISVKEAITSICLDGGYTLNNKKTRFMGPNQVKEITGLILTADGVGLSRKYLNGLRGWFHSIAENPQFSAATLQKVNGTLQFLDQVGGRGCHKLISDGKKALHALQAVSVPKLEWPSSEDANREVPRLPFT